MKKYIKVKIFDHPDVLISRARQAATKQGLQFIGDSEQGLIKGFGIHAQYLLREDILTVQILRKPLFISWTMVEQKVHALVGVNRGGG